jgi:Histidine phosphatase superfamily (branch 1)
MRSTRLTGWLLGLALLVACNVPTPPIISQPGTTTTIIMVRHAERDPGTDPPLNAEGQARAQSLAKTLGENGVTAIYTVDYLRNRQTVQPLADKLGLTPAIVDVTQLADTKTLAKVLVNEWLTKHAGGVVLWVGNVGSPALGTNGSLEDIYRLLGGTGAAPNRYQDLTMIVVPEQGKGNPRFVRTTYGPPSTLDPVTP